MTKYTDQQLHDLITIAIKRGTETSDIEFKDARGGIPKDLWKSISAFSHKPDGGVIVLGIKENPLEITGITDTSKCQADLAGYFNDRMVRAERPDIRVLNMSGKNLVVAVVTEVPNENKPCYELNQGLPKGACVRVGNTNRQITFDELRQFMRNNSHFKFDQSPVTGITANDLSFEKIHEFLKKSATKTGRVAYLKTVDNKILRNLGILGDSDGDALPTIGGYLIFAKDIPQKQPDFHRYAVRCIRYSGVNVASPIIDKSDINGTLDVQIDEMQKFILRNIPLTAEIIGTKRVEKYEYPPEAIRELVANAVIHRDYQVTETYTQISIFSNRIEISNPGNLPPGVTIENIKDSQFSRNEMIASVLKDMDYLEEYGRGIDIVFSRMAEEGLLEPIFKNISNSFKVTLLGSAFKTLNERQVKLWQLIQDKNRITVKECLKIFNEVSRATISNDLNKLISLDLLKQVGSSNNTYYVPLY